MNMFILKFAIAATNLHQKNLQPILLVMAYDDSSAEKEALAGRIPIEDVGVGVVEMGGRLQGQYEDDTKQQQDTHEAPEPPPFCVKLCRWIPLRTFAFIGGLGLITMCILDFLFNNDAFIQFLIRIYLLLCGIVILIVEAPSWRMTRGPQLKVFFWIRILSRMWGRAWFYLFLTILCFAEFEQENPGEFAIIAGFYLLVISLFSFVVSKMAATKLNRIHVYVASGSEGDEIVEKLDKRYEELTANMNEKKLGSNEITKLANEAGRALSNSERHAIQTFLDEACNGYVIKKDWIKQFARLKEVKTRFL